MKDTFYGKKTDALMDKLLQKSLRSRLFGAFNCIYEQEYNQPPMAALIDLTSDCNLNCFWCIDKRALSGNYLDKTIAFNLLKDLNDLNIKSIVYCGGGEPLLHPQFGEILSTSNELGIDCAVYTNGIVLEKYIAEIPKYTKWCRVSIDAGRRKTYYDLHKNDYFNRIITSINGIVRERENSQNDFSIGLSYIVMNENYKEMIEAAELAQKIGCDFIQFKPLVFDQNKFKSVMTYSNDTIKTIKESISILNEMNDAKFSVLITNPLRDAVYSKQYNEIKEYTRCYAQNIIPLITPDGVYICPNWRGFIDKSYGDIKVKSFKKIWYSSERKIFCSAINPATECNFPCIRHRTNALFLLLEKAKTMDIDLFQYLSEIDESRISDNYFI